jgi:hypothetical protein
MCEADFVIPSGIYTTHLTSWDEQLALFLINPRDNQFRVGAVLTSLTPNGVSRGPASRLRPVRIERFAELFCLQWIVSGEGIYRVKTRAAVSTTVETLCISFLSERFHA